MCASMRTAKGNTISCIILGSILLGKPQEMLFLANEWGQREQAECNQRVRVW